MMTDINKKAFILSEKEKGKSYREIGEALGISRQRAEQIARTNEPLKKTKWSSCREEWKELYKTHSITEIAEKFKTAPEVVRKNLKAVGVELRKSGPVAKEKK